MAGSLLCFGVKIVNEKTLVKRFTRFYFLFILVYAVLLPVWEVTMRFG